MNIISPTPAPTIVTATQIWDVAWAIAVTLPGFKTYRQAPILQSTQPEDLPILCSYMIDQDGSAVGDSATGPPRLHELIQLGFSGLIVDSSADVQHAQMAAMAAQLDVLLLQNTSFINYDLIRGIERRQVRFRGGVVGQVPTAEFHYVLTVSVDNIWEPIVKDDFRYYHMITGFPVGGTAAQIAAIEQVRRDWTISPFDGVLFAAKGSLIA